MNRKVNELRVSEKKCNQGKVKIKNKIQKNFTIKNKKLNKNKIQKILQIKINVTNNKFYLKIEGMKKI